MDYGEFMKTKFSCDGRACYGSTIIARLWPGFKEYIEAEHDIPAAAKAIAKKFDFYYLEEAPSPNLTFYNIKNVYRQCHGDGYVYNCSDIDALIRSMTENISCYKLKDVVPYELIAEMLLHRVKRLIIEQVI
jgi:hypothetical protein